MRRVGSKATKADCRGCQDDYYNHGGHSSSGQCWLLGDARIVRRWRQDWWTGGTVPGAFVEVKVPNCYRQSGSYAYHEKLPAFAVEPVRLTVKATD